MAVRRQIKRRRAEGRLIAWWPEIVLGVLALAGYVTYLNVKDARAAEALETARSDDPALYLEDIRVVRGFDSFLEAYASMRMGDGISDNAPEFLIGRWALHSEMLRVDDTYSDPACRSALIIENGRVTLPGTAAPVDVRYQLDGTTLVVLAQDGTRLTVGLAASGINLHHLEVTDGLGTQPLYGYRCD